MNMTLEEEIKMVAESLADKAVNKIHRGCNLWQWKKRDYENGIKAWIAYQLEKFGRQTNPESMPTQTKDPFNT
jgi:hypothetical protein